MHNKWGDPLDDKSNFREVLRTELQVQLRIAAVGPEGDGFAIAPCGSIQGRYARHNVTASGAIARSLEDERTHGSAEFRPPDLEREPGGLSTDSLASADAGLRKDSQVELWSPEASLFDPFELTGAMARGPSEEPQHAPTGDEVPAAGPGDRVGAPGGTPETRVRGAGGEASRTLSDVASQRNVAPVSTQDSANSELTMADRGSRMSSDYVRAKKIRTILATAATWEAMSVTGSFSRLRSVCAHLVHHNYYFDIVMGLVILGNSVTIGLEIQWSLDDAIDQMQVTRSVEHVFLIVFVIELGIRLVADGMKVLRSGWFLFDMVLVLIGCVSTWIVDPIVYNQNGERISHDGFDAISQVLIIRVLRLLRLARALRLLEQFQELWKLANGLLASIRTVLSAWLLIMMTVYIFACLAIELVTQSETLLEDEVCREIVETHFRSLPIAMLTMVQFANADSIANIYTPLISKEWQLIFYFGIVWLIVTICLMNMVTGVIVENAISQSSIDKEMDLFAKRRLLKHLTPTIQSVFRTLDRSGDGMLQRSELRAGLEELDRLGNLPHALQSIFEEDKLTDLFGFFDTDESGEVDEDEFVDGVFHLALQSVPIETTQILHLLRAQAAQVHLIKNLAFAQACRGGVISLAKNHRRGDMTLNVELDQQAVQINGGGHSERKLLEANMFSMRLDAPLRHSYPEDSTVSHTKVSVRRKHVAGL